MDRNRIFQYIPYLLFPLLLLIALYGSYFPFDTVYIGDWHDIFSNTMTYTILDHNYFATWGNLGSGGFPIVASPHSDKYYLFSAPFYLIFQNLTIVNFIILLHLLIAYTGFYKLGSLITANRNALIIFSTLFAFSGALLGRVWAGHHLLVYGLAWLPLLYYFFLKICWSSQPDIKVTDVVGLSVVSALIYFSGDVYHFVLAYLLLSVFFGYYVVTKRISKRVICWLAVSILLTVMLVSIKFIPDFGVSSSLARNSIINLTEDGGYIERGLSSFVFGTNIDAWGYWESSILIGIVPVLLMVVAFIYGKREIVVPSFFALLVSFIWAAGGNTLFSFIHYLPVIDNFRAPGRIYSALLPIILLLSLYGAIITYDKFKRSEPFALSPTQQKSVLIGLGFVGLVKLCELPHQSLIQPSSAIAAILIFEFIVLLLFGKGSARNVLYFFAIVSIINVLVLIWLYSVSKVDFVKLGLVALILLGLFAIIYRARNPQPKPCTAFCSILVASIFIVLLGNFGHGSVSAFNPQFNNSPAPEIIDLVKSNTTNVTQLWVYENGFYYHHYNFTYWDVMQGVHPIAIYLPYTLKTSPSLTCTIGNVTYSTVDYVVDTLYIENGNQNIPNYTFKVHNVSVYLPERVLPNAFFIRNDQMYPLQIDQFEPDDVIVSGKLLQGDVIVLKNAYYPGWTVNGIAAEQFMNMTSLKITAPTTQARFKFDPLDYKIGAVITGCWVVLAIGLLLWSCRKKLSVR
jgi:hypothetical protein